MQTEKHSHSRYLAHSENPFGHEDPLRSHLEDVAERAAEYAEALGASQEARLAGLLHDFGKYGDRFQRRLEGKDRGIDHWSAGAWNALRKYKNSGIAAALAIQGHHIGLQQDSNDSLRELDPDKLNNRHPLDLGLSEPNPNILTERMSSDGLVLPELSRSTYDRQERSAAAMLDIRMLFSALVDADFIETEAHFEAKSDIGKTYRQEGLPLEPEHALSFLLSYIDDLSANSTAASGVNRVRADLLEGCLASADSPQGVFTLSAPTGSGKTLSMLAFALKHAVRHKLRRIVLVIPYLTIIEQTLREYRKVFKSQLHAETTDRYILEHHSLAGTRGEDDSDFQDTQYSARLLTENWDAPIVITTSVQFLESLFSNRPSSCRKLHRLARSVILFDEVQTLPIRLIVPTLATLSHLAHRYSGSVVFATATQPAFTHLDTDTRKFCARGWMPSEIVPPRLDLFSRISRTRVNWPNEDQKSRWTDLAGEIAQCNQSLCIVNLKRHALSLYEEIEKRSETGLFHLSTNMCPAHREIVLNEVRRKLNENEECRLISTQCVEAGVDLDFPVVYRALGPLDAIAQAAGRCNRNGHAEIGNVYVFIPEDEQKKAYPDSDYRRAAQVTRILLAKYGPENLDIHNPSIFEEYYRKLYDLSDPANQGQSLLDAITAKDFKDAADKYQVIPRNAINVLVPFQQEVFDQLAQEVRESKLTRRWIAKARPYTISLFRPHHDDPIWHSLEPIPVGRNLHSEEWFIYLNEDDYDKNEGLIPSKSMGCLIA